MRHRTTNLSEACEAATLRVRCSGIRSPFDGEFVRTWTVFTSEFAATVLAVAFRLADLGNFVQGWWWVEGGAVPSDLMQEIVNAVVAIDLTAAAHVELLAGLAHGEPDHERSIDAGAARAHVATAYGSEGTVRCEGVIIVGPAANAGTGEATPVLLSKA